MFLEKKITIKMSSDHLHEPAIQTGEKETTELSWQNWCRLCAKRELNLQESLTIFDKNQTGRQGTELATSVGKYFWVNIKADDEISKSLCWECKQLVEELVIFTEHVNKVQILYVLLQNLKPSTLAEANKFRQQCGLVDEGWQHIIKSKPAKIPEPPPKPLLIDQQVQNEIGLCEEVDLKNTKDTREILNILCKEKNSGNFKETENETVIKTETEQVNYIIEIDLCEEVDLKNTKDTREILNILRKEQNSGNFKETVIKTESEQVNYIIKNENGEFIVSNNEIEQSVEDKEEVQHSDPCKELIFKLEVDEEDLSTKNPSKRFRIILTENEEDLEVEYLESEHHKEHQNEEENMLESMECLEEENDSSNSNVCNICNKGFDDESILKFHMRNHLPDQEKFNVSCPYCDLKFTRAGAVRSHINNIHYHMLALICDQCGKACTTKGALNEHLLVHTDECPCECEVCHKRFKKKLD